MKKPDKRRDVRSGIALVAAFFSISILLYFESSYFGSFTKVVAIALIVLGFAGLGIELEKMINTQQDGADREEGDVGVFDNIGIGTAMLVVWGALYHYFPVVWVNILTSAVLLFGAYGVALGLMNLAVLIVLRSQRKDVSEVPDDALPKRAKVDRRTARGIAVAISGVVGFIASMIQILQFLRVIE